MVAIPSHDRKYFYKYYSAESAILTLANTSRRWSTPLTFNDPFDNQFDLLLDEPTDDMADRLAREVVSALTSQTAIPSGQFGNYSAGMEWMRRTIQSNRAFRAHIEQSNFSLRPEVLKGMHNVRRSLPDFSAKIFQMLSDTSIFCISETNDSILMWSHYALNHTGAVIKFLVLKELDSPLLVAQPVTYSQDIPRLDYMDLMSVNEFPPNLVQMITLTKSDVWSYEKEWRIVGGLRDARKTHEILPFSGKEVGAIYLGCKIGQTDKARIIEITRQKYPNAELFQVQKSKHKFSLEFKHIA